MRFVFPLLLLCLEFFGESSSQIVESSKVIKPHSFKEKLKRDELLADLKAAQPGDKKPWPLDSTTLMKSDIDPPTEPLPTPLFTDVQKLGKADKLSLTTDGSVAVTNDLKIVLPDKYQNDTVKMDHHTYYNSTTYTDGNMAKQFWIDLDKMPEEHVVTHDMLSDSYRQAATVQLSFDFPFYGSMLRNITIATGGFLYMGEYMHNWIAATQYVAPLMANFDTTVSADSVIKYADNGSIFVVEWDKVFVQDKPKDGTFTFQVTLFKNGDICFVYKEIPHPISDIPDDKHPVKVGISDAYVLERSIYFLRRKTIYEYHRVDFLNRAIANNNAIYFKALETCMSFKDCQSCVDNYATLQCGWCEAVQRCSDGIDRLRQSWVVNACVIEPKAVCKAREILHTTQTPAKPPKPTEATKKSVSSTAFTTSSTASSYSITNDIPAYPNERNQAKNKENLEVTEPYVQKKVESKSSSSITMGAVITILVFLFIIGGVGFWIFYAYRFPQTTSGQFLIKYRPSQWNMKREDPSATNSDPFHM